MKNAVFVIQTLKQKIIGRKTSQKVKVKPINPLGPAPTMRWLKILKKFRDNKNSHKNSRKIKRRNVTDLPSSDPKG